MMRKASHCGIAAALAVALSLSGGAAGSSRPASDEVGPENRLGASNLRALEAFAADRTLEYDPYTVLVRFEHIVTPEDIDAVAGLLGGEVLQRYTLVPGLVHMEVGVGADAAIEILKGWPGVAYAEPNWFVSTMAMPNDPLLSRCWGLHNTGQTINGDPGTPGADIDAPEAWDVFRGNPNFVVAVVDTGIQRTHPDLQANIWTNPTEVAGNGIDDDGNGYIDDTWGWNFVSNTNNPDDDHSHGTHVAGTIGAVGNNGVGISGVNWNVKMAGLKIFNAAGVITLSAPVSAMEYCARMNIKVSNHSWGGGGYSASLFDAIEASKSVGHIFVAAAGNNYLRNNDAIPFYPASYPSDNVISVAATDNDDRIAWFSNYGATSVDIGAPGANVYSTVPNNSYAYFNGTSMASPHVAGVVALVYGQNPTWTYQQVRAAVLSSARPVADLTGRCVTGGVVNAALALVPPPRCNPDFNSDGFLDFFDLDAFLECYEGGTCPPGRTADFDRDGFIDFFDYSFFVECFEGSECLRGPLYATVTSLAPDRVCIRWADTSSCESRFRIERSLWTGSSWGDWQLAGIEPPNAPGTCVTGLSPDSLYRFRFRAEADDIRTGAWQGPIEARTGTPSDCLNVPSNFRATDVYSDEVALAWNDTSTCETHHEVHLRRWNGASWSAWELWASVPANWTEANLIELENNTIYQFRIRAVIEGVRQAAWSQAIEVQTGSVCLQTPRGFSLGSIIENQICFTWNDTSTCESRFVIEQSRWNGSSWDGWVLGENVPPNRGNACRTGLEYDTLYRFRIRAEGIDGASPWSGVVEARTSDCLSVPGSFRVSSVAGNQVCFLWSDTSTCETRFVIQQSRWNGSAWEAWTLGENVPGNRGDACRTGLDYGTLYRFRIRAEIEGMRSSGWSQEVQVTTGADCLDVPGNFRVTGRGCGSVTLAWTDTSTCETRFVIDQSLWNGSAWGSWTFGENVPANATSATRTGLSPDGLYRFRIRAEIQGVRASPVTTNDPEARATPSCLGRPTNLRTGTITPTSVALLWNDNSSCETQFQIYQRRFVNGAWSSWSLGENVPANAERATRDDTGTNPLVRGGLYQFYVIADQGDCESDRSNVIEVDLPN